MNITKQTVNKYKLDYVLITVIVGILGFLVYDLMVMPYLITTINCGSLESNFDNERFSLLNLKQLVIDEYTNRCLIIQSFGDVIRQ